MAFNKITGNLEAHVAWIKQQIEERGFIPLNTQIGAGSEATFINIIAQNIPYNIKHALKEQLFQPHRSSRDVFFSAVNPITSPILSAIDVARLLLDTCLSFLKMVVQLCSRKGTQAKKSAAEMCLNFALTIVATIVTVISPIIATIAMFSRLTTSFDAKKPPVSDILPDVAHSSI